MKILIGFIVLVDVAFLVGCLMMPRSGMEAMGSVFILIPLAGLHLLAGIVACFLEMRRDRWKFPAYFAVSTCLILFLGYLYGNLKPTYRPLHRVLITAAKKHGKKIVEIKDKKILTGRRLVERWKDPDHSELCRAVDDPLDVDRLAAVLKKKPDLTTPCSQIQGRKSFPLHIILAKGYETWAREKKRTARQNSKRSSRP